MTRQWADEVTAFTRAFAGAAVFGIPMVYTMEMWWIGKTLTLSQLIVIAVLGFLANLGLAHVAGFRSDSSFLMSLDQAVDALAVGIIGAGVMLVAMNQIRITDGLEQGFETMILLGIPLSLGASVARQVFSGRTGKTGEEVSHLSVWQGLVADVGASAIGGVFIGMAIAPTDEVEMIAAGLRLWNIILLIVISLILSYIIVFASGFDEVAPEGPFQHPLVETMFSYVIAIGVAFVLLAMFRSISLEDPFHEIVRQTVTLALPVAIGGAGGRLVI